MNLTRQQREDFDRDGYLYIPGLFTSRETNGPLTFITASALETAADALQQSA